MKSKAEKDAELEALVLALFQHSKEDRDKSIMPIRGGNVQEVSNPVNFSLQAQACAKQAASLPIQPEYLTSEDYTRIKVRHWKEEYILPDIHDAVAVGVYALIRAYHSEMGNSLLNLQTRYVYIRKDTGAIISAEERKKLGGQVRTERISYGLKELYRHSGGGGADWTGYQLMKALEQLTAQGYLSHDGADCYTISGKRPERLLNADEFLSFAHDAGISVSIGDKRHIKLDGDNETAKSHLRRMLEYSRSIGIPDTLRVNIIARLEGRKVFYDWE